MKTTLILEFTNLCNLNCVMCLLPDEHIKRGFMDIKLLKKILTELKNSNLKFDLILPFWAGESSIHPQFKEMLSLMFEYNKDYTIADGMGIDTNLNAWDKETIDFVLSANQFVVIHFSIDAFSKKVYKKIRKGGDFERVLENAIYFLEKKANLGLKHPNLVFQFIVLPENFNEVEDFVKFWKYQFERLNMPYNINYFYDKPSPIVRDTIFIRRADAPVNEVKKQLYYENLHKESVFKLGILDRTHKRILNTNEFRPLKDGKNVFTNGYKRDICSGPFTHLAIKFDGRVTLCCQDTSCELNIGNVRKQSIYNIWYGEKANDLRLAHINGKLPYRCKMCFNQIYPLINKNNLSKISKKFNLEI